MIIDFHTHMFPDKIAAASVAFLSDVSGIEPSTDGTYDGLVKSTEEAGIDFSVILPIVTKPKQFKTINTVAATHQEGRAISFGSIHPESEDYKAELREIKDLGLKGIKLHPDYQCTLFNDIRYKRIISYATELGLIISVHAGLDPKSPDKIHCTPQMSREVIDEVKPEKLVLAHMGGHQMIDDVWKYLAGTDVYFDTSNMLHRMTEEEFIKLSREHGIDKILFATDAPWAIQKQFVKIMNGLAITEEEREKIFAKNALQLLENA